MKAILLGMNIYRYVNLSTKSPEMPPGWGMIKLCLCYGSNLNAEEICFYTVETLLSFFDCFI